MDPTVPRRAIAAFEQATGLALCVRDLRGTLLPFLDVTRREHVNPLCRQVKDARHGACVAFCARCVPREIAAHPEGVVKRCHAGLVELTLPVPGKDGNDWILFAGMRRPGPGLEVGLVDRAVDRLPPLPAVVAAAPVLDSAAAGQALELLRQLGARLAAWQAGQAPAAPPAAPPAAGERRRDRIAWLIAKLHADPSLRLADLAVRLGLSEDRAGHAVREVCGAGFAELVLRARLATACALLGAGALPLREVARQSGFGSRSRFFAAFRRHLGCAPGEYRRRAAVTSVSGASSPAAPARRQRRP